MIYDCFPFFNELEILEIRLRELEGVVDRFVLVEATRTHSGAAKRLFYDQNRRHFYRWAPRIIHVVVSDMPQSEDPWDLEHYQRDAIGRGLQGCDAQDVILVSDVDEVPAAERVKQCGRSPGLKVFQQRLAYYFLNNFSDAPWFGTRMLPYELFGRLGGAQAVRGSAGLVIPDGGWHFSYVGGSQHIRTKLGAFAHQEYNTAGLTDPWHIGRSVCDRVDLFGRGVGYAVGDVSELPECVKGNPARFRDWIFPTAFFNEPWYDDEQCGRLAETFRMVRPLSGDVVEIGCWEGRSTVALANACFPEALLAVDTWEGNVDEDPEHPSVHALRERDVFRDFSRNIRVMTAGNVQPIVAHSGQFFQRHGSPIKFCHIDGSHDYESVRRDVEGALAWLLRGGIICGDDFAPYAPGVVRAVRDLLPGHQHAGKLWHWQRP